MAAVGLFVLVAIFADQLAPYSFAAIDLRAATCRHSSWVAPHATSWARTSWGAIPQPRHHFGAGKPGCLRHGEPDQRHHRRPARAAGGRGEKLVDGSSASPSTSTPRCRSSPLRSRCCLLRQQPHAFMCLLGTYGWARYARLVRAMASRRIQQGLRGGPASCRRQPGAYCFRVRPAQRHGRHPGQLDGQSARIDAAQSGLSFLGVGIQPPLASLGNMVGLGATTSSRRGGSR